MVKTIGRRVVDIGQKARGRLPLRYELEVIPYLCGDLPDDVSHCSFAWERGSKLFVTEAEPVNPNTHAVFWKQYLRQTATMYKDHTELLPKEYAFKVQSVKPGSKQGEEKRKTVGKVNVNLAQFCAEALDAQPQEVMLHLKPYGKLKVSIKATWLRNAAVDADTLTEVTAPSMYADSQYDDEEEEHHEGEQDLSGFDPETGEPLQNHRGRRGGGSGGASTSGGAEELDEYGNPLPARRKKHRRKRRIRTYNENGIPEDAESYGGQGGDEEAQEYGDPGGEAGEGDGDGGGGGRGGGGTEEGGRRGRAGSRASKGEGRPRLQVYGARPNGGDTGGGAGGLQIEAGRQVHKAGWRDYLCCCLPGRGPSEDPLEGDSLLRRGTLGGPGNGVGGAPRRR